MMFRLVKKLPNDEAPGVDEVCPEIHAFVVLCGSRDSACGVVDQGGGPPFYNSPLYISPFKGESQYSASLKKFTCAIEEASANCRTSDLGRTV